MGRSLTCTSASRPRSSADCVYSSSRYRAITSPLQLGSGDRAWEGRGRKGEAEGGGDCAWQGRGKRDEERGMRLDGEDCHELYVRLRCSNRW